jgi:transcriptional regulator with XRE-family HTH domain
MSGRAFRSQLALLLRLTERRFIAARLQVSRSTIDKWAIGVNRPSAENFDKLCVNYPEVFEPQLFHGDSRRQRVGCAQN